MRGAQRCAAWVGLLVSLHGCGAGSAPPLPSTDFAYTFTQRDQRSIAVMSTASFRKAVWDRLDRTEFLALARLMGHGEFGTVVDTQFDGDRAFTQMRTDSGQTYRLHLVFAGSDWFVDDVLRETQPGTYASMRRQVEAVLAVRDFRAALVSGDWRRLQAASSEALTKRAWARVRPPVSPAMQQTMRHLRTNTEGLVGPVSGARDGSLRSAVGTCVFYFVSERGALVVDDVGLGDGTTLQTRSAGER